MAEQRKRSGNGQKRRSDMERRKNRPDARRNASKKSAMRKRRRKKRQIRMILVVCVILVIGLIVGGFFIFGNKGKKIKEGTQLLEQKKYEEAVTVFDTYLKEHTGADEEDVFYQAEANRGLGIAYYEMKQYEKAIESLKKAVDLGGEMTPALYNLIGISAMNLEDYDGALEAFEKGCLLPTEITYTDVDGKEQKADYAAVIQEMKFNRIVCFEKKLDWESAKSEMETYLTLYPDDEAAKKEAEFLASMQF